MLENAPTLAIGGVDTAGTVQSKVRQVTNQTRSEHRRDLQLQEPRPRARA